MATVGSLVIALSATSTDFERALGKATRAVKSTEREFRRAGKAMESVGRSFMLNATLPIVGGLTAIAKAAIDLEDQFADVRKTVTATEAQLAVLDKTLRDMTERIPVTYKNLSEVASVAGQLGIQADNIAGFTETIAHLSAVSKSLVMEDAALALAQFANIMGTGQRSFDRMGSTILRTGQSLATTENRIVEYARRLGGAGKIAGFTEAQIIGLGGAFGSVGIEAEAGGTGISKALQYMTEAVATGSSKLGTFARTAGMSARDFSAMWQDDAAEAFTRFVEGLGRAGDDAFLILKELGLRDQRLSRGLLATAGAGDLLRRSIALATEEWETNTYLLKKAEERYQTAANRLKMLWSRLKNTAVILGEALSPLIETAISLFERFNDGVRRLSERFAKLPAPIRSAVGMALLLVASVGPLVWILGKLNILIAANIGIVAMWYGFMTSAAFAFTAWQAKAATLGEAITYLFGGKVKMAIFAISALVVASILIAANWDKLAAVAKRVWHTVASTVVYAASLVVRAVGWILTAISWIIPGVKGAAQAVMGLANTMKVSSRATAVTETIADQVEDVAAAGDKAAQSQQDLADALGKAGKAANKNLQSFDEVHLLQEDMGGAADTLDMDFMDFEFPEIPTFGGGLGAGIGEAFAEVADKARAAWEKLAPVFEPVNRAVQWIKDNWPTIGPIVEGIATTITVFMLPALIQTGIEALIAGGKVVASWVMQSVAAVSHVAKIVGQIILVVAKWAWMGIQAVINAGKVVLAWAMQGWEAVASVAKQIAQFIIVGAKWVWLGVLAVVEAGKVVLAWVAQKLEAIASVAVQVAQFVILGAKWVWMGITAMANAAVMAGAWFIALGPVAWVIATIAAVAIAVALNWDWVKEKTIEIWAAVSTWLASTWDSISTWATEKWGAIKTGIQDSMQATWDWLKTAWNSISSFLSRTWDGIKTSANSTWKGIANTVIGFINRIIDGLNAMIKGMNKLKWTTPDWIPFIGGKSFGFNLQTLSRVPMLAKGTNYVPYDTLAYLHQGEAVIPKAFNPSASAGKDMADDVARAVYQAIMDAIRMSKATGGSSSDDRELVLKIDNTVLARMQLPAIIREGQRQGLNLVVQPQGV